MRAVRVVCLVSLLVLSIAVVAYCQVNTGTITGTVSDPTGAVIPGAQVTVVQTETNFQSKVTANTEGLYRALSLLPGTYRLTFEAAGFKRLVLDGTILRVGDVLPVNATLEVGQVGDSIEVSARSTLLETETSATGTVHEGETLYNLNLYQRQIVPFMPHLVPGTSGSGSSASNVIGQRASGTSVFSDGVFAQDPVGSGTQIKPVENSVEEAKLLTGTLPAEYGHSTGGLFVVVNKSGTNSFHGFASDFGRTRSMSHRQFFNLYRSSQAQPGAPNGVPGWFQEPDASGGGPVVIPHIYNGRNRTFFYIGYQKLIEKKASAYISQTPSLEELSGDFNEGGKGAQLYDPYTTRQVNGAWTRDPLPGNLVPVSRMDPVAKKILAMNVWVPPNFPGSWSSTGPVSNYQYQAKSRTFYEDYHARIDHQFSTAFKLYGSYTYNHQSGRGRPTSIAIPAFDNANGLLTPFTEQNYSVGASYLFGPTTFNDLRIGFYRARNDTFVPSYNQDWASTLGLPNVSPALLPSFSSSLASGYTAAPTYSQMYGLGMQGPSKSIRENLSFRDDLSKMVGTHAFKMGYEHLLYRANYWQLGQPSGTFLFDNMTAGLQASGAVATAYPGNQFAAWELGAVRQANFTTYTTTWLPRDGMDSLYVQDDWKIRKNLTLNLGLRWSTESPFHTAHDLISNFSPTTVDPLTGRMGAIIHPTTGLNSRTYKDFQPRLGAAYHFRDRWVFRGGFGLNTIDIRFPNSLQQFDEYQAQVVQQLAPGDPRMLFQLSQGPSPVKYNVQPDSSAAYVGTNYSSRSARWMDGNLHPGYAMNWNATVEYQVSTNNILKAFYQGSAGVRLVESWNVNVFPTSFGAGNPTLQTAALAATQNYLPYPQFGSINYMSNTGHSSYHAGTIQFERRHSQGLVFNAFYTISKAIDDCDSDSGTCTGVAPVENRNLAKGRAGFDRHHILVVSETYELPIGKGRHFVNHNRVLDLLIGGFNVSWITTVETGNPMTFSYSNNPNNEYPGSIGNQVPNLVCNNIQMVQHFRLGDVIGGNRFDQSSEGAVLSPNCFAAPAAFTPGNAGRNIVTGPGVIGNLASASKTISFSERWKLQVRFDFQNPFHNFSMSNPTTGLDFKNPQLFGKITSDPTTFDYFGQPLMDLTFKLSW